MDKRGGPDPMGARLGLVRGRRERRARWFLYFRMARQILRECLDGLHDEAMLAAVNPPSDAADHAIACAPGAEPEWFQEVSGDAV